MMTGGRHVIAVGLIAVSTMFPAAPLSTTVLAQPVTATTDRVPTFAAEMSTVLRINSDNTSEELTTERVTILAEPALKEWGVQQISFSETIESLEILEAFTQKTDGRKIAVESTAMLTQDGDFPTRIAELIEGHDQRVRKVIFPALAVGDTTLLVSRKIGKSQFPGQLSKTISITEGYHQTLTIISSRERPLIIKVVGVEFSHQRTSDETTETQVITIPASASFWIAPDEEPGAVETPEHTSPYIYITSHSYPDEFGQTYWTNSWASKVEITPDIKKMADEITLGIDTPRHQAEAIDHWVKKNIRYVAFGDAVRGVVPDPAALVLGLRYGDCKNRSALTMALLAAKNIRSEFTLISVGTRTSSIPAYWRFDHVFLYLPEFDIYTDTQLPAPFGVLKDTEYDKPVLRLSADGVKLARTPPMKADDHTIQTRTKMVIGKDKIIAGETTETTTGTFSLKAWKFAASLRDTGPKKAAADRLKELETPGAGNFEAAVDGFINPIGVSGQFTLAARLKTEPSESWTPPVGLTVQDDPFEYFFGKRHEKRRFAFTCHAGRIQEEVEVSFAEGIPLPKPAKARTVNTPIFSYKSAYALENRTLKIRREFASHVQSQACPAELEAFITQPLKAVQDDLETEFVFTGSRTSRSSNEKRKTKQPISVLHRSLPGRG